MLSGKVGGKFELHFLVPRRGGIVMQNWTCDLGNEHMLKLGSAVNAL